MHSVFGRDSSQPNKGGKEEIYLFDRELISFFLFDGYQSKRIHDLTIEESIPRYAGFSLDQFTSHGKSMYNVHIVLKADGLMHDIQEWVN